MATIPIIQDSATLEVGTGRRQVQAGADAFGAAEARGAGQLAQGLDSVSQAALELDARFDEANVRELETAMLTAITDEDARYLSLRGRDAVKGRDQAVSTLDQRLNEIMDGARSDRARQVLFSLAQRRRDEARGRWSGHAIAQQRVYEDNLSTARIEAAMRAASVNFNDDAEIARQLMAVEGEVRAMAGRAGQDEAVAAAAVAERRADLAAGVLALRVEMDPVRMLRELRAAEPQGLVADLEPTRRAQLMNAAQAELNRREAERRSRVLDEMRGAMALIEMGEMPTGDMPSVEEVRAILGENQAAAYQISLMTMDRESDLWTAHSADLAAMAAAAPSGGTERERYDNAIRRAAAANILQRRAADPMAWIGPDDTGEMQEAIRRGNFDAIGERLRRRTSLAVQLHNEVGVQPNPLTVGEAAALRQILDRLSPEQRVQALATLRRGAAMPRRGDGGAYGALLGQLYADNPGALAGAAAATRRGASIDGGRIAGPTVARRMMAGAALLNPEPIETNENGRPVERRPTVDMPSAAALQGAFNTYVGDAYAGDPDGYERAFQAFRSYYVGAAVERGLAPSALTYSSGAVMGDAANVQLAGEAAQVAVGQLRDNRYGGVPGLPSRTYLPWGLDEDAFMSSLRQGWPVIRQRYESAELSDDPADYDYSRDQGGFYVVWYRGVPVPDGEGGYVRVRPRVAE